MSVTQYVKKQTRANINITEETTAFASVNARDMSMLTFDQLGSYETLNPN